MREMKPPWFKAFALCTTLGLGGAYVWRQQQKAAPQIDKTVERTVLSGSKSSVVGAEPWPKVQVVAKQLTMLPGSKSSVIDPAILPVDEKMTILPPLQLESEVKTRVLMPSSKSGWLRTRPGPPPPPLPPTLLPGSKGGVIQLVPKIDLELPSPEKPNAPKQRTLLPGSKSIDPILKVPQADNP